MYRPILCCFKLKSATLLIGVFDLMFHMIVLATLFVSISNPTLFDYHLREYLNDQTLAGSSPGISGAASANSPHQTVSLLSQSLDSSNSISPSSSSQNSNFNSPLFPLKQFHQLQIDSSTLFSSSSGGGGGVSGSSSSQSNLNSPNDFNKFPNDYYLFNSYISNKQDRSVALLVTSCSSLITIMLIYGLIKNKPSYLMPYFSIKVFQVVITCLTALGFYSCLPNIREWLKLHRYFPLKETLLSLDHQTLELFIFAILLMAILVKLYVVIIIWYCYRYMITMESFRNINLVNSSTANGGGLSDENNTGYKIDDESLASSVLMQPPKYEDIVKQIKEEKATSTAFMVTQSSSNNSNQPTTSSSSQANCYQASNKSNCNLTSSIIEEESESDDVRLSDKPQTQPPSYNLAVSSKINNNNSQIV